MDGGRRKSGLRLTDEEVFSQLEKAERTDALFLWRYSHTQLMQMFERFGILARIEVLGYSPPRLTYNVEEGLHHLLLRVEDVDAPLVDLRLSEESRIVRGFSALGSKPLAVLVIQWVSLQHVLGEFTPERPQLPGQNYPGLGVGRRVYRLLWRIARENGKDAMSAYPMYYHNAVYYLGGFAYLNPQKTGELLALQRDLSDLPLDKASDGINRGCLRAATSGEAVDWNPGEMFAPVSRRLGSYFSGRDYRNEVQRSVSKYSFRLA
jgi:hypothetical protein